MGDWIKLNVGGHVFNTTRTTLMSEPNSMLGRMFDEDNEKLLNPCQIQDGAFLIDRPPKYFEPILNYLRSGKMIIDQNINPEGVLEEARYFGMQSLIPKLEEFIKKLKYQEPLTRFDFQFQINALYSRYYNDNRLSP